MIDYEYVQKLLGILLMTDSLDNGVHAENAKKLQDHLWTEVLEIISE